VKEGYVIRDQNLPHFLTATIVDWIDVFSRKSYRDCIVECFDYCINLRHSIATHLLENEMSIEMVRDFLGHTQLGTTQVYTRINFLKTKLQ
jgi:hypothetical protein